MSESYLTDLYPEELYSIPGQLLILIDGSWDSLSNDDQTLLTNILKSVRHSLSSVRMASRWPASADWSMAISFGVPPTTAAPLYQIDHHLDRPYVLSDNLKALNSPEKKKALWAALLQLTGGSTSK